jgi:hypothetical protein
MSLERFIKYIQEGEPVSPGTPNRPLRQLDQNINYLWSLIEAANLGSTVYAREQTLESTAELGMPVYWNAANSRFERGLAGTETDVPTGYIQTSASSQIWGVVAEKHEATLGDILLFGYAKLDISAATGDSGTVPAGLYYLSGRTQGGLAIQKPPISIPVLRADGAGSVFVNPTFMDVLQNHQHYKFDLTMLPAGDVTPPSAGSVHTITNADSTLSGWLPADDAVFGGNAPAGAKFGYNMSADFALDNAWPPLPLESSSVELLKNSIYDSGASVYRQLLFVGSTVGSHGQDSQTFIVSGAQVGDDVLASPATLTNDLLFDAHVVSADQVEVRVTNTSTGPAVLTTGVVHVNVFKDPENWTPTKVAGQALDDLVVINRDGIWWMKDCYDNVPWATDYDSNSSVSESAGPSCPHIATPQMLMYFAKVNFATDQSVVTSLESTDSRLKVYCRNTTDPKSVGDLDIDLDLNFTVSTDAEPGYLAFKSLDGENFKRGPVAEGVYTTTPTNVTLSGDASATVSVGGTNREVFYGNIGVNVNVDPTQELGAQLVRLEGVTEEHTPVLYLGMSNDYQSSYTVKFDVPFDASADSTFKYRVRLLGRVAGTLPQLAFSYVKSSRPSGLTPQNPVPDGASASISDLVTTGTLTLANSSVEATQSTGITGVQPGDIIYITVTRDPADAADVYTGEVGVMQQTGVLN